MRFVYKSLIVYFIAWAAFSNPCLAQTIAVPPAPVAAAATGDTACDPEIQASQQELREMVIESKKESIKEGMKATGKKISDFSCLKDLWGGFGGGIDIMALLMKILAALRDAACAAASAALSGVTGGVNALVQSQRDALIESVNGYLMAQATALTSDLQNDLNALEDMTSEESIQKRADGLTGPYTEKVEKDYELMLYD